MFLLLTISLLTLLARCFSLEPEDFANVLPLYPNCGQDYESYRIRGNGFAYHGQDPWSAIINITIYRKNERCGGSLINSQYVLTAAHCFDNLKKSVSFTNAEELKQSMNLELGQWDIDKEFDCPDPEDCDPFIRAYPDEIILHEGYRKGKNLHDIALVKLQWPLLYTKYIRPVCLLQDKSVKHIKLNTVLSFTGFGKTNTSKALSTRKKHLTMKIVECSKNQRVAFKNHMFCAVTNKFSNAKTCKGDSGGAVILNETYAVGILSMGPSNCDDTPFAKSTFVKIIDYIDWIKNNIRERLHSKKNSDEDED